MQKRKEEKCEQISPPQEMTEKPEGKAKALGKK